MAERVYQRFFEIQNSTFVDRGRALDVNQNSSEGTLTYLKRISLTASGIVLGTLAAIPPMSYVISEATQRFAEPTDATKVGAVVAVALSGQLAAMLGGAYVAEGAWEKFFKKPDGVITIID